MKNALLTLITGIVFGVTVPVTIMAQESEPLVITVEKAVDIALENNLILKTSKVEFDSKVRAKRNRWNEFLPSIAASTGLTYSDQLFTDVSSGTTDSTDPTTIALTQILADYFSSEPWTMTMGAQASLNLNLAMMENVKKVTTDYEAGFLSYEQAMREVERDIQKQFYGLISFQASIDLLQKNIDMMEKRYQQAKANYENGLLPEVEVLSVQVTVANLKPTYDDLIAQYENMLLLFKFQLGLDLDQEIVIEGTLEPHMYEFDPDVLVQNYLMKRLDIQILDKQIASIRAQKLAAAYGLMTPTIALSATWGSQVNDFTDSDKWEEGTFQDNFSFSMTLAVPLDSLIPGSKGSETVKGIQDGIDMMNLQKEMAVKSAKIEIVNVVKMLNTSKETIGAYKLSVDLARKSFELTDEAYQVGTKEQLDVEAAQNSLFEAESKVIGEKVQYISGLLDLEYALSTPIEDIVQE